MTKQNKKHYMIVLLEKQLKSLEKQSILLNGGTFIKPEYRIANDKFRHRKYFKWASYCKFGKSSKYFGRTFPYNKYRNRIVKDLDNKIDEFHNDAESVIKVR